MDPVPLCPAPPTPFFTVCLVILHMPCAVGQGESHSGIVNRRKDNKTAQSYNEISFCLEILRHLSFSCHDTKSNPGSVGPHSRWAVCGDPALLPLVTGHFPRLPHVLPLGDLLVL
jgi:hypothetical protein